jgi:hypothetical protein
MSGARRLKCRSSLSGFRLSPGCWEQVEGGSRLIIGSSDQSYEPPASGSSAGGGTGGGRRLPIFRLGSIRFNFCQRRCLARNDQISIIYHEPRRADNPAETTAPVIMSEEQL